ncbi:MAG: enoyl-CoA hydratase-related protein [Flavobacteriaceae bacterium]|nr:enoyl-CoA hydratase-related protein [Flavobacteriaceae bacterium]MDZ4148359.1 enoyl-CoA hydratase-related protein [Flavobacteriaceae bacterium]
MANYQNILYTIDAPIATITINRPEKLNALNKATLAELRIALEKVEKNAAIRVLILTGSGNKAFVAGADIAEFSSFDKNQGSELAQKGQESVMNFLQNFSKPIIAAINGYALGGGLELAMAAHIRIASDNAKMGLPEVSLGVIPGYGGTQRLSQLIGKGRALEMIVSAQTISASQALEYGLVNHVVSQENLFETCLGLAQKIASNSPKAIGKAIEAVNAGFDTSKSGFDEEIRLFGECFGTEDFKEGITAFLEKRKAEFPGK